MLMSGTLHHLLLAGICLCVSGTPVHPQLPYASTTEDGRCDGRCASSVTRDASTHSTGTNSKTYIHIEESAFGTSDHVTGLIVNIGGEGGAGPDGRRTGPKGILTQAGNGNGRDGRSGPSEAEEEAWSQRSEVEAEAASDSRTDTIEDAPVINDPMLTSTGEEQMDGTTSASSTAPPQRDTSSLGVPAWGSKDLAQENGPWEEGNSRASLPSLGGSLQDRDTETSTEPPNPSAWIQRLMSHSSSRLSPISASSFLSPQTPAPLSAWGPEGGTISTLPDPLLPDIGPNLTPREDGPESLWTEAVRQSGVDTVVPLSQDEATEGTMSSEALPLIFEPFDDVTPEGAATAITLAPGSSQPLAAMATRGMLLSEADFDQLVTVETDSDGPSHTPPLLLPDWTSPWQTSGAELLEPFSPAGPSGSPPPGPVEDHAQKGADRTQNLEESPPTTDPSPSSTQHSVTPVTMATHRPASKWRAGLEEMESDEEPDEDEEDENTEESEEEESEEDLTETPNTASTRPPYSLIPPPPVWVQRNQGLMRSWVELIREKAGYVSGMLAPVGIGITGALLIVGALYSIRMIHRMRRNSFKHQRRKQSREPSTSGQDQAMLLADSSEDEF